MTCHRTNTVPMKVNEIVSGTPAWTADTSVPMATAKSAGMMPRRISTIHHSHANTASARGRIVASFHSLRSVSALIIGWTRMPRYHGTRHDYLRRDRRRARRDGQRGALPTGAAGTARARTGSVRVRPPARLVARRITHHSAGLLRASEVRAAAAASVRALGRAGARIRRRADAIGWRPDDRSAGR